jgi:UDP-N-acetylglucosamine diphosphorylase / glucose-1-phosphate thymidylyltransferase / UDP-N-acetylgalactosamine diphosphorylase / glucosamine-1-phosphate N-acetyltransferase / galactosamine-1-phosphate N-acetyltransferase
MIRQAVIPAGGRGVRAWPATRQVSKVLLEIDHVPLIERNIVLLRDAVGIRDIVVITGHLGDQIRQRYGDGAALGVSLRYVDCPDPDAGLAQGMLSVRHFFNGPFVTLLGDELYLHSNHSALHSFWKPGLDAMCGVTETHDVYQIKRNYSVVLATDGLISALEEKPQSLPNSLLGCGTYVFTPTIFDAIERTAKSPRSGRVELTDAIGQIIRDGGRVAPFPIETEYFNINTVDDLHYANYRVREADFAARRISVIIPAYNEQESIAYVVRDFLRAGVHEVFVVNNSSRDRTATIAADAGARVETVSMTGYGDTILYGLDHANGDILVVVEADFSFRARDLRKMLEYLKDADMVIGTRTTRELIEQGTNMRGAVRWGNVVVAKIVEALWWGQQPRFTDVGCTYRALWRETYETIRPFLRGVGPELAPEMMVAALQACQRIIEVPVSYHRRIGGVSKHSANYFRIARTATRMLRTIALKRAGVY